MEKKLWYKLQQTKVGLYLENSLKMLLILLMKKLQRLWAI
jgi:hypothetical protein